MGAGRNGPGARAARVSRIRSLARLAAAYGVHQVRQPVRRSPHEVGRLLDTYAGDRLRPLTGEERDLLPELERCVNCGLCAFAAGRFGSIPLPQVVSAYLRDLPRLPEAAGDLAGSLPDFAAAEAACPVGVPLRAGARMLARLAGS